MKALSKLELLDLGCDEKLVDKYVAILNEYYDAEYKVLEARKRRFPSYNDRFSSECIRENRELHEYYEPRLNKALLIALERMHEDGTML